jgi:hypothetical protein
MFGKNKNRNDARMVPDILKNLKYKRIHVENERSFAVIIFYKYTLSGFADYKIT